MRKLFALLLAWTMALSLVACNNDNAEDTGAAGKPIKIGILAPLTGDVSVYGNATFNGIMMAIEEINAKGGVLGRRIEPVYQDEQGDPSVAVNAYNNLYDQGIIALLGDVTSKPCIAVAEVAKNDKMPMLTPTGTAAEITTIGANVFRTCFMDPFQGQVMATFAADELKAQRVAVIYDNGSDYSLGLAAAFKAQAAQKGLQMVAYEAYASADTDFTTLLNKIVSAKPDVLFLPDYYSKVSLAIPQARAAGYQGIILGGDGWDGVLGAMPEDKLLDANNGYFSNHYAASDTAPVVVDFLANYKARYHEAPNSFSALGYDSAYIMADAIERAGSTDSQAIIDALATTHFSGVTGDITFDANGDPIKSVAITKFVDGVAQLATKIISE